MVLKDEDDGKRLSKVYEIQKNVLIRDAGATPGKLVTMMEDRRVRRGRSRPDEK